jgi:TatD DNase family protein
MQLIDTHVHINFDVFQGDLNSLEQRWREAGVVHLVHSCVEPQEFQGIKSLADRFPELSFAIGLHPLDVQKWTEQTAQQIETLASSDSRVVAIGETGLDLYKADNYQEQRLALESQLNIARKLDKPVIIHCREAAPQLKEIVSDFIKEQGNIKGVMHCWGGTPEETAWFLDLGFYISFSGTVTFKKAQQIKESAKIVPQERILVETDCPFLAPVPKRGKTNEPSFVKYVAQYVAHLRGITLEELAQQTTTNACRLFKLDLNDN